MLNYILTFKGLHIRQTLSTQGVICDKFATKTNYGTLYLSLRTQALVASFFQVSIIFPKETIYLAYVKNKNTFTTVTSNNNKNFSGVVIGVLLMGVVIIAIWFVSVHR